MLNSSQRIIALLAAFFTLPVLTAAGSQPLDGFIATTDESRIINGGQADLTDAPYIVAINAPDGYAGNADGELDNWCGGALISSTKVLTAAHCVEGYPNDDFELNIGSTKRLGGTDAAIADSWVHPEYESPSGGHDVAVLTLDREVEDPTAELNDDPSFPPAGEHAVAFGWGETETGDPVNDLRKVTVPVVGDEGCSGSYATHDSESMLCAGYHEGGMDACQGDSGGPLVMDGQVVGLVSHGTGCAMERYYGVYTRVSSYSEEISAQL